MCPVTTSKPPCRFGQGLPEDTICPEVQRVLEGCDLVGTGRGSGREHTAVIRDGKFGECKRLLERELHGLSCLEERASLPKHLASSSHRQVWQFRDGAGRGQKLRASVASWLFQRSKPACEEVLARAEARQRGPAWERKLLIPTLTWLSNLFREEDKILVAIRVVGRGSSGRQDRSQALWRSVGWKRWRT